MVVSFHLRPISVITGASSSDEYGPVKHSVGYLQRLGQDCVWEDEDLEHGTCFQVGHTGVYHESVQEGEWAGLSLQGQAGGTFNFH